MGMQAASFLDSLRPLRVSYLCDPYFFGARLTCFQDIKTWSFTWLQFSAVHPGDILLCSREYREVVLP